MSAALRHRQPMSWVPWVFVGAFLVVIAVNTVLIVTATRTFSGLVVDKPYLKGVAYEKTLAREAAQAQLGWQVTTAFRHGELALRYLDAQGQPLPGLGVQATIVSPVGTEPPMSLSLAYRGMGWYAAAVALPRAGQWEVTAQARAAGDVLHEQRFRFVAP